MTISSVNLGYQVQAASSIGAYNKRLSQETIGKLEKYGIPYNQSMSDSEGKALVAAYEKAHEAKQPLSQDNTSGKDDLMEKAKQLAQKLGIQVEQGASFENILIKIEEVLNQKALENRGNVKVLEQLKNLNQELSLLQAQSVGSLGLNNSINKTLMDSLEALSQYNKAFLY